MKRGMLLSLLRYFEELGGTHETFAVLARPFTEVFALDVAFVVVFLDFF